MNQHAYGLEASPVERLRAKDLLGKKVMRQRVLTDPELRALWQGAESLTYPYGPLFQLLALTGQRKSEVAEARWREFDLGNKLWTIPPERMKSDAAHVVPLVDEAIAILESLPRFKSGDYLFSTKYGASPCNGFSKAKQHLDAAMATEMGGEVEPFVIHDIRRTMRTGLSALPIPDRVRELVIAHAQPGLHKIYDQYAYLDEKRHALSLWTARLRSIVMPPPDNVVRMREHGVQKRHLTGGNAIRPSGEKPHLTAEEECEPPTYCTEPQNGTKMQRAKWRRTWEMDMQIS